MTHWITASSRWLSRSFSWEPSSLQHAFSTLLIASFAYLFLCWRPSSEGSWLILVSILLAQAGLTVELNSRSVWKLAAYLVWGFLTALAVFVLSLGPSWFLYSACLVFSLVALVSYFGWLKRDYFFAAFIANLLTILAAFSPTTFEKACQRFYLIVLGSFLVFIVRLVFFFYLRPYQLKHAKVLFFQKLKKVYELIFYAAEKPHYLSRELEESHFITAWSDCLAAKQALKGRAQQAYLESLDRVWDLTLSLGSLRYRLTDYTVLTMSQAEMQALLESILAILNVVQSAKIEPACAAYFDSFQAAIQRFEELYRSLLQTLAKEPLVLLLFIQDLYALKEELEKRVFYPSPAEGASLSLRQGKRHEKKT